MAEVRPFAGLRYNSSQVADLADVITPPYDIISKDDQDRYYERSPYNSIRLELGRPTPYDSRLNTVYTRAAATLAEWRLNQIITEEAQSAFYLYQQRFTYQGQQYSRTSLLTRIRVEPWEARVVLPHEETLAKARADRLQLLEACSVNTSPIMCLYEDPQGRIRRLLQADADNAEVVVTDDMQVEHRLHIINDPQKIALLQDFFAPRQLYIADGHHRYTTALNYLENIRQIRTVSPEDGANFVLASLIDLEDPGMLVLPTHRLLLNLSSQQLLSLDAVGLSQDFQVESLDANQTAEALQQRLQIAGEQTNAFILMRNEECLLLQLNEQGRKRMTEVEHQPAWQVLDVAVAQQLILMDRLHFSTENVSAGHYIRYTHDFAEAYQNVRKNEVQAAILLNRTPLGQVRDVAEADERMPQKSTYIYPKLITGLVMNPLW